MPGFKASKDMLTLLLRANAASDFKVKPMLTYHHENSRALKNYANSTLPVSINGIAKPKRQHVSLQHVLLNVLRPLLRPTIQKKVPFKILMLIDNAPGHPRTLIYNKINVAFHAC